MSELETAHKSTAMVQALILPESTENLIPRFAPRTEHSEILTTETYYRRFISVALNSFAD